MKDKMYAIAMIRYLVFAMFVLMITHCGLLSYGIDLHIAEISLVTCGFILIHVFSRILGFCSWHRMMIYYDYVVVACIWWKRWAGFGPYLHCARTLLFVSGVILLAAFFVSRLMIKK